jgi:hypothetical protein
MEARESVAFGQVPRAEPMQDPGAVVALLRSSDTVNETAETFRTSTAGK